MNDVTHWLVTAGLGLLSLVLTGFAAVLWAWFRDLRSELIALQRQNESQERDLATIKANVDTHDDGFTRLEKAMERMDSKIDQLMIALGRRPTPYGSGSGTSR